MKPEDDVQIFDQLLGELVVKYEQYFLGMEKREPLQAREQVSRLARKYQPIQITNTMYRFRYNNLIARFSSYQQHWNRIVRLIEEGKYSRDKFKAEMHLKQREVQKHPEHHDIAEETPVRRLDPQVENLYRQYLAARQACSLPTGNIAPEQIAAAVEKQKPEIIKKFHCSDVEFKVVVEEGKPKIKAIPRR